MKTTFGKGDKVLVLDFDHTCYDTDTFLLDEIRGPMLALFGVSPEVWEEAYSRTRDQGYNLELHRQEMAKVMGKDPCTAEDMRAFGEKMNFNKYLYPDTLSFIQRAKDAGYKIMILSFGEPSWQDKKVLGVHLDKYVDQIQYTLEDGYDTKAQMIEKYLTDCDKVVFVDNKGSNLDAIHEVLPQVETYLINRVPTHAMDHKDQDDVRLKYFESRHEAMKETKYTHKMCSSLEEISI